MEPLILIATALPNPKKAKESLFLINSSTRKINYENTN